MDISLLHVIEWRVKVPRIFIQNPVTRAKASDEAGAFAWKVYEMASRLSSPVREYAPSIKEVLAEIRWQIRPSACRRSW